MRTKAIIFDLDGTAVDSPMQKLPTERLKKAANNLSPNYYLCAATGRCWTYAKDVIQSLGLKDLCIISGGTQICDPQTGEVVWQKDIAPAALKEVIKIFSENGEQKIIFNDYTEDDYFNGGTLPKDFDTSLRVNWLSQSFVPDELAIRLHKKLDSVAGVTCVMVVSQKSGCRDLHIVDEHATKEHAIAELLHRLGIKKEMTIGIGDGHNDIHLFNAVQTKVAMGNAVEDLKAVSDVVIGDVRNDGLAEYFEELFSSHHQLQQQLVIDHIADQVSKNTLNFSTVAPVADYVQDTRISLTSVHIPRTELIDQVQTLLEPLKKIEPNFYYYPDESLHLTIKNIRVSSDPPNFDGIDVNKAKEIFADVVPKHKQFKIYFYRLLLFPNNLALIGTTDPELDMMIFDLNEKLKKNNLADDKVYANSKYFFSNMTLARFNTSPSQEFKRKVVELSNSIKFEPYEVDSVTLLTCNAVCQKKKKIDTWKLLDY